jgi:hypothetical protein
MWPCEGLGTIDWSVNGGHDGEEEEEEAQEDQRRQEASGCFLTDCPKG